MHRSHIPIQAWFWAAYLVATHTPGISAVQIQRQLGSSSNTTAWHMLHRLRKGMVNEHRSRLSGLIEADESIIGGPAKGKRGRGVTAAKHKTLVIGAVEILTYEDKKGKCCERARRLRLSTLDDAGEVRIRHFLTQNIEVGSTLRTDGWRGYSDDALVRYKHRVRVVRTPERAHRVAHAQYHDRIDVFGTAEAILQGEDGLVDHWDKDAVGDKSRRILDPHRFLTHLATRSP